MQNNSTKYQTSQHKHFRKKKQARENWHKSGTFQMLDISRVHTYLTHTLMDKSETIEIEAKITV